MASRPTHAPQSGMGMNNEFNYRSRQSRPDPHLPLPEQYCRTRSSEGKKPRGSNARLQALLQCPARRGRCGVGPEDRKRSVRCSRKLRHRPVLYMVQHAGGVNLAPICNRSLRYCWGLIAVASDVRWQLRRRRSSPSTASLEIGNYNCRCLPIVTVAGHCLQV